MHISRISLLLCLFLASCINLPHTGQITVGKDITIQVAAPLRAVKDEEGIRIRKRQQDTNAYIYIESFGQHRRKLWGWCQTNESVTDGKVSIAYGSGVAAKMPTPFRVTVAYITIDGGENYGVCYISPPAGDPALDACFETLALSNGRKLAELFR